MIDELTRDIYLNQKKIRELSSTDLAEGLRKFLAERSGVPEGSLTDRELFEIAVNALIDLADKSTMRYFLYSLVDFHSGYMAWRWMNEITKRAIEVLAVIPKSALEK